MKKMIDAEIVTQSASLQQPSQSQPDPVGDSAAPAVGSIIVSAEIQDEIADYLANADSDRFWALAITKDGKHLERSGCAKVGYSGKAAGCLRGANVATQENTDRIAIERCGGPSSCLLLYQGVRKVANVELITQ
jgi:hypothetical protein